MRGYIILYYTIYARATYNASNVLLDEGIPEITLSLNYLKRFKKLF
jgi:hypothetical protein